MIGNTKYLSSRLGAPTLDAFTKFLNNLSEHTIDIFYIDPKESNQRAIHVYERAGFQTVGFFYRDFGDEKNVKHLLMIKVKK